MLVVSVFLAVLVPLNINFICHNLTYIIMSEERDANIQEFKLEPDCELRFEVESKNEKVILEVS